MAQPFQDLYVWQRAVEMSVSVYRLTGAFPKQEMYGLASQLQRASVSVASNIAEGRGRLTPGEFRQFLGMAQGSNYEVQTQIAIARKLGFARPESLGEAEGLSREVGRMLSSLIATVGAKPRARS
jgi:four helix bundle protein